MLLPAILFTTNTTNRRPITGWSTRCIAADYWTLSWWPWLLLLPFLSCTALSCPPRHLEDLKVQPLPNAQQQQLLLTEVVGGSGRIGSQFMRLLQARADHSDNGHDNNGYDSHHQPIAVPRGVCPGSLSSTTTTNNSDNNHGDPIFVCTPAASWQSIYESTLSHRRCDLVFVGNGLMLTDCVVENEAKKVGLAYVIPHYAVSSVGAKAVTTANNTIAAGPPTYLYGKHARTTAELLHMDGIDNTEIVVNKSRMRVLQAQKVLWASCLWLLCHSCSNTTSGKERKSSITVSEVHLHHAQELEALVREMWPCFQRIVMANVDSNDMANGGEATTTTPSFPETMDYLKSYSNSIPNAIPSIQLALSELQHRNGLFAAPNQSLHQKLIRQVAGSSAMQIFDSRQGDDDMKDETITDGSGSSVNNDLQRERKILVNLQETIGMTLSGTSTTNANVQKSTSDGKKVVIVVGAGIVGSSIACNLARRMKRNDPTCTNIQSIIVVDGSSNKIDVGPTTRASWAWLNANRKRPAAYQMLNCLGMHAWRNDPLLRNLPVWNGSLVRLEKPLDKIDLATGFYSKAIGPLSLQECQELEPNANLFSSCGNNNNKGYVYSFPNEGFVDPSEAVQVLRNEAMDLGVEFLWNHNVTRVLYSDGSGTTGHVIGIECIHHSFDEEGDVSSSSLLQLEADCIVVAAGTGSSASWLGGLPMQYSPGSIAFALPTRNRPRARQREHDDNHPVRLKRILVDTIQQSHVLQRGNGNIVVGGGVLELGGTGKMSEKVDSSSGKPHQPESQEDELLLLSGARQIAPGLFRDATFSHTSSAVRPIPRDGLPSVGYIRPGLYSAVSHSAFTLALLLGAAVAAEISLDVDLDLLAPYRPDRLFDEKMS